MKKYIFIILMCTLMAAGCSKSPSKVSSQDHNEFPVADAGDIQNVSVGSTICLNGSRSSDPDRDLITYKWEIKSRPNGSSAVLSGDSIVNPTFIADAAGVYVIDLVVNDGIVDSGLSEVSITAFSGNVTPVANAGNSMTVLTGSTVNMNGSLSSDFDHDRLTYKWEFKGMPDGSTAVISGETVVNPAFIADKAGIYELSLVVTDEHSAVSTADTVIVVASSDKTIPVANAGNPQNASTGSTVTLDGSASSDSDGDQITYQWYFSSVPEGSSATILNADTVRPTFIPDVDGAYVVTLVVSDGVNSSTYTTTYICAGTGNIAPVADAGDDKAASPGSAVTLDGSGSSDIKGDALTYQWYFSSIPSGSASVLSGDTSVNPVFTPDVEGAYVIKLVVNDGINSSAADTVVINVALAPDWEAGYPKLTDIAATTANLKLKMNRRGYAYFAVSASKIVSITGQQVKDAAGNSQKNIEGQVMAGIDFNGSASAERVIAITGLNPDTVYYVYVVAENDKIPRNLQAGVVRLKISRGATMVYSEDFEEGWGNWSVSNGVWEIGTPTSGPGSSYGGTSCAATILAGNYPADTDSRLVSPRIQLGSVDDGESIFLRFWHWFSLYRDSLDTDYAQVQVQTFDETTSTWSSWTTVSGSFNTSSAVWSITSVDLTSYAGKAVRLGFLLTTDDQSSNVRAGWYIDDLEVVIDTPVFSGNFESGWNGWWTNNGVWEIGTPTSGPGGAHGGTSCAATVLAGNYPVDTDSYLLSPAVKLDTVTGSEGLYLRFWHWFVFYKDSLDTDYGIVQIQTLDESTKIWSSWVSVSNQYTNSSSVWSYASVDLTSYAGETVRLGFLFITDDQSSNVRTGWYIDDLSIDKI